MKHESEKSSRIIVVVAQSGFKLGGEASWCAGSWVPIVRTKRRKSDPLSRRNNLSISSPLCPRKTLWWRIAEFCSWMWSAEGGVVFYVLPVPCTKASSRCSRRALRALRQHQRAPSRISTRVEETIRLVRVFFTLPSLLLSFSSLLLYFPLFL